VASVAFLIAATVFLAYTNGANDNFKGVATLYGSGTTSYRRALAWATLTTLAGSLVAIWYGAELVKSFSGKGLVPDAVALDGAFSAAVGFGAAGTVLLATRFGFPISTTHAMTGALVGAGLVATGGEVDLTELGSGFFLPLLVSPVLALLLAVIAYLVFRFVRLRLGVTEESAVAVVVGKEERLFRRYRGKVLGFNAQEILNGAHYLSAGGVSLARGLNDAPKIVALIVVSRALELEIGLELVAAAMAIGGLVGSKRIADTMANKITAMNAGQGFTANLVTAVLVIGASRFGVPVSTTHVSCGAIFGIGAVNRRAHWNVIGQIVIAWVTTVPVATACAALVYFLVRAA
jgi:PiT family inorganic phosphate transporter